MRPCDRCRSLSSLAALGQQPAAGSSQQPLPNAPGTESAPDAPVNQPSTPGSAAISGTVLDTNGSEVQAAQVVLQNLRGDEIESEQSGSDGAFSFTGLPPGVYKVVVSGQGWATFTSPEIELQAGEQHFVLQAVLPLATSTTVRVVADREELAGEQFHIAEQQRILGIVPNFISSFDWNAPPLGAKQKFQLSLRSLTDPMAFLGIGVSAGVEQETNAFSGYGSGLQGYAKRYGAAYTTDFTARILAQAAFPSLFHQDPRYFYKGTGSFRSRAFYAISAAVMARGDNGHWGPNYSYILGIFSAGAISNLYYPPGNRGALLTFTDGLADIAIDAAGNLAREFVLKRFTSRAKRINSGQP